MVTRAMPATLSADRIESGWPMPNIPEGDREWESRFTPLAHRDLNAILDHMLINQFRVANEQGSYCFPLMPKEEGNNACAGSVLCLILKRRRTR